jgi:hypothetical protein
MTFRGFAQHLKQSAISSFHALSNLLLSNNLINEGLCDLCSSPNVIRVIKSRIMRWDGHVARFGDGRGAYRTWVVVWAPEGKSALLEDLGLDGWMTLNWIFKKWDGCTSWIGLAQLRDKWRAFVDARMSVRVI